MSPRPCSFPRSKFKNVVLPRPFLPTNPSFQVLSRFRFKLLKIFSLLSSYLKDKFEILMLLIKSPRKKEPTLLTSADSPSLFAHRKRRYRLLLILSKVHSLSVIIWNNYSTMLKFARLKTQRRPFFL